MGIRKKRKKIMKRKVIGSQQNFNHFLTYYHNLGGSASHLQNYIKQFQIRLYVFTKSLIQVGMFTSPLYLCLCKQNLRFLTFQCDATKYGALHACGGTNIRTPYQFLLTYGKNLNGTILHRRQELLKKYICPQHVPLNISFPGLAVVPRERNRQVMIT